MIIYILTFAVFALILLGSYRALGGDASTDTAAETFVGSVVDWLRADWATVAVIGEQGAADDALVDQARAVRKKLSGYQQQLARLDDGVSENVGRGRREAVSDAIESLGWACRMVEAGSYATNDAVRAASAELYRAAGRDIDAARPAAAHS